MAVVTESFSIREFTERMRSVDLRRSWPFVARREDALSLPPISVRRFKWWTDDLDAARSEAGGFEEHNRDKRAAAVEAILEVGEMPPLSHTEMEASAAQPAGEDGRRAGKGKQKTPKKRSIVELFAAAPLIAGAVEDEDAESVDGDCLEEGRKDGEIGVKGGLIVLMRRKKKGIMETNVKRKNGMKKRRKKKKKKKKKGILDGLKLEIRALEKEKIRKSKIISSVQSYIFQNPLCSKNNRKAAGSFIEMQKKTRKAKSVQKHTVSQTSKLFSMNKEVVKKLPVRSILKNQKKSGKIVSAKAANLIKLYCESNKHVTFSVEDDILGSSSACSTMDFPQMQNLCKIFSNVLAASSAINHSSKGYDLIDNKDKPQDANSSENGTQKNEISFNDNKDMSTNVNSSNSSCSGTEKASFPVMVDLNRAIEANDFDDFIPATSTLSSSCTCSGDPTSRSAHEKNQNSNSEILLKAGLPLASEPIVVPAPHDDATSSLTLIKESESLCQPHVDAGFNSYHQIEDYQSSKGLLSSICYSLGSKKLGKPLFSPDSVPTFKSKCPGENFIGLPLNSQGELIQFHSGTKLNEAYKKQNIDLDSNSCKNHSDIMKKKVAGAASYQKNYYSTKERVRHWLNFAELDGSKRMGAQRNEPIKGNDRFLRCNSNMKIHDYRNGADLKAKCNFDYHAQPVAQSTMRLMGKNVVVGGISRDFSTFNDRRTTNKKENFAEQTRISMFPDKSLPKQWMQRENITHAAIGRSKGSPFQLSDSLPKFHHMNSFDPSFDYRHTHQPQWLPGSSNNHLFNGDIEKHVLPSQLFSNNCPQFLGNYIPGEGSICTEHHYPTVGASRPQNIHQNILPSSSHCRHNQRLFCCELSTTKPQFKSQDFGKFSQPPFVQPAAKLPQWLLNAKQQKRNQIPVSHYSHQSSHLDSGDAKRTISMKKKDVTGTYSNFPCFKAPLDARKFGKRPAEFDDGIIIPAKRPQKGKDISLNFQQTENGNCTYGTATGSSSSRFDNELRAGPIKLIGGAKHILKPCQRIDDENCRPIHSTIVYPATAASFGTEKKLSNIYKF